MEYIAEAGPQELRLRMFAGPQLTEFFRRVGNLQDVLDAIITLLAICKLSHRQSYADIAAVTMLFPLPALALVITLGTVFGSF